MTSLKTSIKTITYLSDIGCLEIQGASLVTVNGKVKHITELDDITLCLEWTKLREENNRLYEINNQANRGWRGFILRLIGVNLPDKRTEFTQCLLLTRNISGSVIKK